MEIRSDIALKGDAWANAIDELVSKTRGDRMWTASIENGDSKFFDTQWALFKVCLAIGILYDRRIEELPKSAEVEEEGNRSIPRNMVANHAADMNYFFNAAILTTNTTSLNETDRLYLAFSEEITEEEMEGEDIEVVRHGVSEEALKFDKVGFLIGFANYGVTKICEQIDNNINVTMENISEFLIMSYQGETPELREMREVEDILDDEF